MAYTIRIPIHQDAFNSMSGVTDPLYELHMDVRLAVLASFVVGDWKTFYAQTRKLGQVFVIEMRKIRLKEKDRKPYCGQHAGPCFVDRPRNRACYLESADWIRLHNAINVVLDLNFVKAEIFSSRVDQFRAPGCRVNKFSIRSIELGGRKRYDYIDGAPPDAFRPHYLFDPGTPNQFGEDKPYGHETEVSALEDAL